MTDRTLLDQFVNTRSHEAFATLVHRHIAIVYGSALRQVREASLAEDVAQSVFIVLAHKAGSLGADVILPGWLIRTTHLTARDALKAESRRKRHEQRYAAMITTQTDSNAVTDEALAAELSPEIDRALARLNDAERGAIVLRYLQGQSVPQVAAAMKVSEEAATKRLQRALIKLRGHFARRPVTASAAMLASAMQHLPPAVVPASLAPAAINVALAGTDAAAPSAIIAKGALKRLFWTQSKVAAATAAAVILTIVGAAGTVSFVRAQTATESHASMTIAGPSATSVPTTKPASATAATPIPQGLVGRLTNGISVEMIGVCESPSAGRQWWCVDGTPLEGAPYYMPGEVSTRLSSLLRGTLRGTLREFAVRITNPPAAGNAEPASARWRPERGGGGFVLSGAPRDKQNQAIPGMEARGFLLNTLDPIDIRFEFATGPWQLVVQSGPDGNRETRDGLTFEIGKPFAVKNTTHFKLTGDSPSLGARRMMVEDIDGQLQVCTAVRMTMDLNVASAEYSVPLPPARVKAMRFESRPFDQWIMFKNVCVDPKNPTKVTIVTSDETQGI